ncbi:hypothetical protein BASA81_014534 [Batrachochytrium salamandrivorans]|nr:hypothetical protein BASA81_014534 [Batrachochytrium salamandrivorans]
MSSISNPSGPTTTYPSSRTALFEGEEYQRIHTSDEREAFFTNREIPFIATLDAHFESERPLQFLINKDIVDIIIGDLRFYPDDVEGILHTRALTLFKLAVDEEDSRDPEQRSVDNYVVTVKMTQRFNLCVRYIACGATFRMASRLMQATVEESGLAYL